MTNHRRPAARKTRRSGRTRAVISLGAVAVLATGMSVKGTFAFWTDDATAATGSFSSGKLDITVNGQLAGTANDKKSTTIATLALADMVPGESVAGSFPIKNEGTTPLLFTGTGTGAGPLAVAGGIQYSVTFGATASNTGTIADGNRKGSCGVVATDTNTPMKDTTPHTFATNRPLAVGATENVCIVAHFSTLATNSLQGLTGSSATFLFASKQVGS